MVGMNTKAEAAQTRVKPVGRPRHYGRLALRGVKGGPTPTKVFGPPRTRLQMGAMPAARAHQQSGAGCCFAAPQVPNH
eukprot:3079789-Alexandrium_andersonii.AAC.1